jgi:hypothetical protein
MALNCLLPRVPDPNRGARCSLALETKPERSLDRRDKLGVHVLQLHTAPNTAAQLIVEGKALIRELRCTAQIQLHGVSTPSPKHPDLSVIRRRS